MSNSMYMASVPVFLRLFSNLNAWLDKAEAHAAAKKFDTSVYLAARLAPDMLPFTRQIQIACDGAKFCVARLASVDAPKHEDDESTFGDLRQRIAKTVAFLQSVDQTKIAGTDDKEITVPRRTGDIVMKGEAYLNSFALPNFYFHMTAAYALLRHNGVELGKSDFLGLK